MSTKKNAGHIGQDIARIREFRQMKQATLAMELGMSQQSISKLEKCETIDEEKLEQVAKALGVTKEVIGTFSEEAEILLGNSQNNVESVMPQKDLPLSCHNCNLNVLYRTIIEAKDKQVRYLEMIIENHIKEEPTLYIAGRNVDMFESNKQDSTKVLSIFRKIQLRTKTSCSSATAVA